MEPEVLHYDSARLTQQLFNHEPKNLLLLDHYLGVKAISRDGWIKLEGDPEKVEVAKQFFGLMENACRSGHRMDNQDFENSIKLVATEGVEMLKGLRQDQLKTSSRKPALSPKTIGQKRYIDAIRAHDVTLGIGPAGTGKTYLAMAMAILALKEEKVSRIILTRPAVEAGEALGFLPGDLYEKISPYLRPLHDALHDMLPAEDIQKFMDRGLIEIAPLAYMRGRTLNHSFIVLDEAQNATTEQMLMFLTRMGFGSKCVVTGDPTQVDLPKNRFSGLVEATRALKGVEGIAMVEFQKADVVRHPLVQRIVVAYERYRGIKSGE